MSKIKRDQQSAECTYVLHPLGKGLPFCMYGIKPTTDLKLQDIPLCKPNGKCRKEKQM